MRAAAPLLLLLVAAGAGVRAQCVAGGLTCGTIQTAAAQQCTGCGLDSNTNVTIAGIGNVTACQAVIAAQAATIATQAATISGLTTQLSACRANQSSCGPLALGLNQLTVTAPVVQLSVRLINDNYGGPIMRVQRSSDGAQTDVFPNPNSGGLLNTATIASFVGVAGIGYVAIWYDQSGAGNHYSQETASVMPIIAINGIVVTTADGAPTLLWNSTTTVASTIPSWYGAAVSSAVPMQTSLIGPTLPITAGSMVINVFANTTTSYAGFIGRFGWDAGIRFYNTSGLLQSAFNGEENNVTNTIALDNGTPVVGATPSIAYTPGTLAAVSWTTPASGNILNCIGGYFSQSGARVFYGTISEVVLYSNEPSATDMAVTYANQNAFYSFVSSAGLLGTIASTPTVAYSTRQLGAAYTGPCVGVRRSSDNTIKNIGFNGTGDLDYAALLAFVGTGNGFVATLFDQSGHGNHATQATAGNQPQIVNAGALYTSPNGRVLIAYAAAGPSFLTVPNYSSSSIVVSEMVVETTSTCSTSCYLVNYANGGGAVTSTYVLNSQLTSTISTNTALAAFPTNRLQTVLSSLDGTNQNLVLDGVHVQTQAATLGATVNLVRIGNANTGSFGLQGYLPEFFAYAANPSFWDLELIRTSQNEYFQIGPLPVAESLEVFNAAGSQTDPGLGTNYVAYSVRLVVNAYAGKCMNVRRSNDSATQDIGFTIEGTLDVATMLEFVGPNNSGSIAIWYDQGPLSANAVQTNATNQPLLVQNGALLTTYSGRPAPTFNAAAKQYLVVATGFSDSTTAIYGRAVASSTGNAVGNARILSASSSSAQTDFNAATSIALMYVAAQQLLAERNSVVASPTAPFTSNFLNTAQVYVSGTTLQLSVNGQQVAPTTISSASFGVAYLAIGASIAQLGLAGSWDGQIEEIFVSSAVPTTTAQTAILQSQQKYFNTYNAPVSAALTSGPSYVATFGLRLLLNNYTGPLVDVQRSSDNVVQSFYPDYRTGVLNTTAIQNFVGLGTGYVSQWYDQSGNGNNVLQSVQGNMPRIAAAGFIVTQNNQPCLHFIGGSQTYLQTPQNPAVVTAPGTTRLYQIVASPTTSNNPTSIVDNINGESNGWTVFITTAGTVVQPVHGILGALTTPITANVLHTIQTYDDTVTFSVQVDTNTVATESGDGEGTNGVLVIGSEQALVNYFDGFICEVIYATAPSSADRSVLHYNERAYFATP